jgi:hypothetical protein
MTGRGFVKKTFMSFRTNLILATMAGIYPSGTPKDGLVARVKRDKPGKPY